MKVGELNGNEFHIPTSGGKAGKGKAITGSIQVRRGNRIVKQFRFRWMEKASRSAAIAKAKSFAQENGQTAE